MPIAERLKGIAVDDAFLVDHSSLLVPSHCGQYFGKRIERDKIVDGDKSCVARPKVPVLHFRILSSDLPFLVLFA